MNGAQPLSRGKIETVSPPQQTLGESFNSLLKKFLFSLVDSRETPARVRKIILWVIFWLFLIFLLLKSDPAGWSSHVRTFFVTLFVTGNAKDVLFAPFDLLFFTIKTVLALNVSGPMIVLLAPFLIARQMIAIYLQDIFELDHTQIARKYIMQSALASEYERINIHSGTIDPKRIDSPLVQIGGPGRVQVELDSAALFEKPDGTARVVGPTVGRNKTVFIEGFERLREVIDLHDISVGPLTTVGRSRDGIPVSAKDVRMRFSVQRGNQKPTLEKPHPFVEEAIHLLVYRQSSFVIHGQPNVVSRDDYWKQNYRRWGNAMPVLINTALTDFVSEHNLSEFLANTGKLELEALQRLEKEIQKTGKSTAPSETERIQSQPGSKTPEFTTRSKITNLFYDFASGFSKKADNRGVQLEWIGVGTWETSASEELINKNHLEAWRISRENYLRGHPKTLERLREEARLQRLQDIINKVLLESYRSVRQENLGPERVSFKLLIVFREQLLAAYDLYERDRKNNPGAEEVPFKLTEALRILNGFLAYRI